MPRSASKYLEVGRLPQDTHQTTLHLKNTLIDGCSTVSYKVGWVSLLTRYLWVSWSFQIQGFQCLIMSNCLSHIPEEKTQSKPRVLSNILHSPAISVLRSSPSPSVNQSKFQIAAMRIQSGMELGCNIVFIISLLIPHLFPPRDLYWKIDLESILQEQKQPFYVSWGINQHNALIDNNYIIFKIRNPSNIPEKRM